MAGIPIDALFPIDALATVDGIYGGVSIDALFLHRCPRHGRMG
jgi:hypothetical protein